MLVTLDFETYYDQDYTLKKLSTSEYIRDPRFEVINASVRLDDGVPKVYWGGDELSCALHQIDWSQVEFLAHHCQFEGLILSHHFGVRPKTYRDTLSMARALFPKAERNDLATLTSRLGVANKLTMPDFKGKRLADFTAQDRADVGEYVKGDVISCYEAYHVLLPRMPAGEMELIDTTVRMFADPVLRLDVPLVEAELKREIEDKGKLIAASGVDEDVLQSSKKLAGKLMEYGVVPPMKVSLRTGKPALAMAQTDLEFTALARHSDPRVAALVNGRLAAKSTIGETRATRLLKAGTGLPLPVYLNYCGAHTTRWSGGDKLNFQNFPRPEKGVPHSGALRRSLLAPDGQVIVVVDSSQIEVRVLAWLAGERWLLDAFAEGLDAYCVFGTKAYGRVLTKKDNPEERQLSKVCVLALGYGMGAAKLQRTFAWGTHGPAIDLPMEVCEGFVKTYRSSSRAVCGLWDTMNRAIGDLAMGREGAHKVLSWEKDKILLPNGLSLLYPNTRATFVAQRLGGIFGNRVEERVVDGKYTAGRESSKLYGGLMVENVVQALARVIVADQMREIARRYRVVLMSHDEVVYLTPEAEAQEAYEFGIACLRKRPTWGLDIPLDAEGGFARNYSK